MPLIKQQFKVDMFQLKNTRDPEELRTVYKEDYARRLGLEIINKMPYSLIEKFEGELPSATLTKDHHFTETWGVEFLVFDANVIRSSIKELESDAEELIQERDNEEEANAKLGVAKVLKDLLNK